MVTDLAKDTYGNFLLHLQLFQFIVKCAQLVVSLAKAAEAA